MTARDSIAHLTVLDALFNFGGIDVSGKNCYKVPPGVEFGEYPIILLRPLISFKTDASIPKTHQELFALVRLADVKSICLRLQSGWKLP